MLFKIFFKYVIFLIRKLGCEDFIFIDIIWEIRVEKMGVSFFLRFLNVLVIAESGVTYVFIGKRYGEY